MHDEIDFLEHLRSLTQLQQIRKGLAFSEKFGELAHFCCMKRGTACWMQYREAISKLVAPRFCKQLWFSSVASSASKEAS